MNYRRLGQAGVKVSEIGLGGWLTFANAMEKESAKTVMDAALDAGINFLDTANAYMRGGCESAWGELLQDRRRPSYVLATKVFFAMDDGPNDKGLSRKHIVEQCEASLRRLKTDYIDLYQCHRFDPDTPLEETVRAMDDLIRRGKVLYWGFSEWSPEQIEQCLQVCGDRFERPRGSQPQYNLMVRWLEERVFPLCQAAGIGQVVYSPLAQGVLTGKYRPKSPPPPGSRAADDRQNRFIQGLVTNDQLLTKVQTANAIANEVGIPLNRLALAWCLRRPELSSCIIGASRAEQVHDNAAASGLQVEPEVFRRLEEAMA